MDSKTREQLISLYSERARITDAAAPNLPTTDATVARMAEIDAEIEAIKASNA